MCKSGVAHCQSQQQYNFWQMNLIYQSVLHGQVSLAAVNHIYVFHEVMNGCKNQKIH